MTNFVNRVVFRNFLIDKNVVVVSFCSIPGARLPNKRVNPEMTLIAEISHPEKSFLLSILLFK